MDKGGFSIGQPKSTLMRFANPLVVDFHPFFHPCGGAEALLKVGVFLAAASRGVAAAVVALTGLWLLVGGDATSSANCSKVKVSLNCTRP